MKAPSAPNSWGTTRPCSTWRVRRGWSQVLEKLPPLSGKCVAITGCTTGLGFYLAELAARKGAAKAGSEVFPNGSCWIDQSTEKQLSFNDRWSLQAMLCSIQCIYIYTRTFQQVVFGHSLSSKRLFIDTSWKVLAYIYIYSLNCASSGFVPGFFSLHGWSRSPHADVHAPRFSCSTAHRTAPPRPRSRSPRRRWGARREGRRGSVSATSRKSGSRVEMHVD